MKTPRRILSGVILVSSLGLMTLSSCKKDQNKGPIPDDQKLEVTGVIANHETAMQSFSDNYEVVVSQFSDLSSEIGRIQNGRVSGASDLAGATCYETTVTPKGLLQWPKTVERNYQNCQGADGSTRNGKVISVFSEPIYISGATITTTFENYTVDSFQVSGSIKYTNDFSFANGDTVYAVKVDYTNCMATHVRTGFWTKINGSITYKLENGKTGTFNPLAPFTTSGSLSGENSIGFIWKAEATTPVLRKWDCRWPLSGELALQWNNNSNKATIDYGDGKCDNKASVSYKGYDFNITLY